MDTRGAQAMPSLAPDMVEEESLRIPDTEVERSLFPGIVRIGGGGFLLKEFREMSFRLTSNVILGVRLLFGRDMVQEVTT